jgi:hypothetical protein
MFLDQRQEITTLNNLFVLLCQQDPQKLYSWESTEHHEINFFGFLIQKYGLI